MLFQPFAWRTVFADWFLYITWSSNVFPRRNTTRTRSCIALAPLIRLFCRLVSRLHQITFSHVYNFLRHLHTQGSRECRTIMANFPVFQETEGEWTSMRTVEILGVRIPAYFTTDPQLLYDFITNFQTKPDDVFIVSYPKSGKLLEKTTHAICSKWQRTGRSCY